MFWCDKCKIWEHEKCLADAIRKEYLKSKPTLTPAGKKARKSLGKSISITIEASEDTGEVTAYVNDTDRKASQELEDGIDQKVKADTERNGSKTVISVKCLRCGSQLK